jgi:hypothetical protein
MYETALGSIWMKLKVQLSNRIWLGSIFTCLFWRMTGTASTCLLVSLKWMTCTLYIDSLSLTENDRQSVSLSLMRYDRQIVCPSLIATERSQCLLVSYDKWLSVSVCLLRRMTGTQSYCLNCLLPVSAYLLSSRHSVLLSRTASDTGTVSPVSYGEWQAQCLPVSYGKWQAQCQAVPRGLGGNKRRKGRM